MNTPFENKKELAQWVVKFSESHDANMIKALTETAMGELSLQIIDNDEAVDMVTMRDNQDADEYFWDRVWQNGDDYRKMYDLCCSMLKPTEDSIRLVKLNRAIEGAENKFKNDCCGRCVDGLDECINNKVE